MIRVNSHKVFAASTVAAFALHAGAVLIAGFLTPDYLQTQRALSDLGISRQPYAFLINYLGFAAPGFFILLAALSAKKMLTFSRTQRIGLLCMAWSGISLIIAGLYPFPSSVHLTAALLAGISASAGILGLSLYALSRAGFSILAVSGFAIALLILTDAATWVLAEAQHIRLHDFMGFQQRLASFSAFFWFSAFAIASARKRKPPEYP